MKRTTLPLRFSKTEWKRMDANAKRRGWRWAIAVVDADATVSMLGPARAHRGRELRLGPEASIENLLTWIDARV